MTTQLLHLEIQTEQKGAFCVQCMTESIFQKAGNKYIQSFSITNSIEKLLVTNLIAFEKSLGSSVSGSSSVAGPIMLAAKY